MSLRCPAWLLGGCLAHYVRTAILPAAALLQCYAASVSLRLALQPAAALLSFNAAVPDCAFAWVFRQPELLSAQAEESCQASGLHHASSEPEGGKASTSPGGSTLHTIFGRLLRTNSGHLLRSANSGQQSPVCLICLENLAPEDFEVHPLVSAEVLADELLAIVMCQQCGA